MHNIEKGCDKIMTIDCILERPQGYGIVDYDDSRRS
jgi:hypothetical protein